MRPDRPSVVGEAWEWYERLRAIYGNTSRLARVNRIWSKTANCVVITRPFKQQLGYLHSCTSRTQT